MRAIDLFFLAWAIFASQAQDSRSNETSSRFFFVATVLAAVGGLVLNWVGQ